VYKIDGVEYVDVSKRNDTAKLILTQDFFDNVQENFMQYIFLKLQDIKIPDFQNITVEVPDLMKLSFNVTNIQFYDMYIDNQEKLMEILDKRAIFALRDVCGALRGEYMYISDPPLFTDIGVFDLNLKNLSLSLDGSN